MTLKKKLYYAVMSKIDPRKNQTHLARRLKISQPQMNYLMNGKLGNISSDLLYEIMLTLNLDVVVRELRPSPDDDGGDDLIGF